MEQLEAENTLEQLMETELKGDWILHLHSSDGHKNDFEWTRGCFESAECVNLLTHLLHPLHQNQKNVSIIFTAYGAVNN